MMRNLIRKLLMLDPGYRKAFCVEQKLDRTRDMILAAIEAARPADRTDELKAAIEAAKPVDRTDEIRAAIEAAKPADRTDEIKAAIEAARPADRTDEIRAAIEAAKPADRTDELKAAIEAAKPVDRTDELKAAIEAAKPADRTDEINTNIADAKTSVETRLAEKFERVNIIGGNRYNALLHHISSLKKEADATTDAEVIRNALRTKWALVDRLFKEPTTVKCPVCETSFNTADASRFESVDIWGGGNLVRYACPGCGLIFGPMKMLSLSAKELAEDYQVHYSVFSEGDCTDQEKRVFKKLNPRKGCKYLNWGCGAWGRTIDELRSEGYDVYGYEPFAAAASPYVYHSMDQMQGCRFDGIFSHDLLEHVVDPVAFFRDNVSLLADGGVMVHSTACFEYVYEYTRFHLCFYTGNSLGEICRRVGIVMVSKEVDDANLQIDVTFRKE